MRKTIVKAVVFLIAVSAALCLPACAKRTDAPSATPVLSGIELEGAPHRYYAPGEPLDYAGLSLRLLYSDGTQKALPLDDAGVRITCPGTNIEDRAASVTVWYGGFKTSFGYYVSPAGKVVESVSLDDGGITPELRFARTDGRPRVPAENFRGMCIVVKYRPGKNESVPAERRIDLYDYAMYGVRVSGWDAATTGVRTLTFSYLADSFDFEYTVVDEDWIDDVDLMRVPERNYFTGSGFAANDAFLRVTYNSGKTEEIPLTGDVLSGFDTRTAGSGRKYTVVRPDGKPYENDLFVYNVFERGDRDIVDGVVLKQAPRAVLSVNDPLTLEEYRAATAISVIVRDGQDPGDTEVLNVTGADPLVLLRYSADGGEHFEELNAASFEELKKKGRSVKVRASWIGFEENLCAEDFDLLILRKWIGTEIENWPEGRFTAYRDRPFDFGDAKIRRFYDDGFRDSDDLCDRDGWYLLRDIYALPENGADPSDPSRTKYGFDINTSSDFLEASSIDTGTVGVFDRVYLIAVAAEGEYDGRITVNGESVECTDGRLYVNYEVLEPAPEPPPESGEGASAA